MSWILPTGLLIAAATWWPLAIKWELPRRQALPGALFAGLASAAITAGLATRWPIPPTQLALVEIALVPAVGLGLIALRFYRDPERAPILDEGAVLSPADGTVVYVKPVEAGSAPIAQKGHRTFPLDALTNGSARMDGGYLIGIGMSYLDVHVNRAPIGGRILLLKHIKGSFLSLKLKTAILQNERVLTVFGNARLRVGMVQIASRLVRRITPYVRLNQLVRQGDRVGRIAFGSQVDVLLPAEANPTVLVRIGQRVTAGRTVLATVRQEHGGNGKTGLRVASTAGGAEKEAT